METNTKKPGVIAKAAMAPELSSQLLSYKVVWAGLNLFSLEIPVGDLMIASITVVVTAIGCYERH